MKYIQNIIFILTLLLFISCNEESSKQEQLDFQKQALEKIVQHVEQNRVNELNLDDYRHADFHAVTKENINNYRESIDSLSSSQEIQETLQKLNKNFNQKPIALSKDITLHRKESTQIILEGNDEDIKNLAYVIVEQPAHGTVTQTFPTISGRMAFITYTPKANEDFIGNDTFTFKVNDGIIDSDPVDINTSVQVDKPIANAGLDQLVTTPNFRRNDSFNNFVDVTLDGSKSSDKDGNITNYFWQKIVEPQVIGTKESIQTRLFPGIHTIKLTVTDNDSFSSIDTIVITVNEPPLAFAGQDKPQEFENVAVQLNGLDSSDRDGRIVSFVWKEGESILSREANFSQPFSVGIHILTLTVTDDRRAIDSDNIRIEVLGFRIE